MKYKGVIFDRDGTLYDSLDVIAKFIGPEKKQEAFNRFFDYYRTHFEEIRLYPGIRDLLLELKESGTKLMLFTGGGHLSTRFCLEQTGILHLFDALICGEDVLHPKPNPEGVLKHMEEQNLQPGDTIVVGDAASDVEAGKAARTFTAWLCWSENAQSAELNVSPDFTCRSVDELRRVLT